MYLLTFYTGTIICNIHSNYILLPTNSEEIFRNVALIDFLRLLLTINIDNLLQIYLELNTRLDNFIEKSKQILKIFSQILS